MDQNILEGSKTEWYVYFRDQQRGQSFSNGNFTLLRSYCRLGLNNRIDQLNNTTLEASVKANIVQKCQSELSELSNQVQTIASSTPAHDLRNYSDVSCLPLSLSGNVLIEHIVSQAISQMTEKLHQARKASASKRKFEFKPKSAKATAGSANSRSPSVNHGIQAPAPELVDAEPVVRGVSKEVPSSASRDAGDGVEICNTSLVQPTISSKGISLQSLSDAYWVRGTQNLEASFISLVDIQHCLVDLSSTTPTEPPVSSLTINQARRSLIVCGTIAGAAHITNMKSSTLVLESRQVRIHDCTDCVLYLRCDSKPIIENCSSIKFAPKPTLFVSDRKAPVMGLSLTTASHRMLRIPHR